MYNKESKSLFWNESLRNNLSPKEKNVEIFKNSRSQRQFASRRTWLDDHMERIRLLLVAPGLNSFVIRACLN